MWSVDKAKWRLEDLRSKIDYEGGIGAALFYFGRDVNSESEAVNRAWRRAYAALIGLYELIPEPQDEE